VAASAAAPGCRVVAPAGAGAACLGRDAASIRKEVSVLVEGSALAAIGAGALVEGLSRGGARIVDVRPIREFMGGHVPGSISVPHVPGQFEALVRSLLPVGAPAVLIAGGQEAAESAAADLRALGHQVLGFLDGGTGAWTQAGHPVEQMREFAPAALQARLGAGGPAVLDVREPGEWAGGVIPGAICIRLGEIASRSAELDPAGEYVAVCAHGVRSLRAAWLLEQRGFARVANLVGGMQAWTEAGLPVAPAPASGTP